jgi:hypothetical protein
MGILGGNAESGVGVPKDPQLLSPELFTVVNLKT